VFIFKGKCEWNRRIINVKKDVDKYSVGGDYDN